MEALLSSLAALRAHPYPLKLSATVLWTLVAAAWLRAVARRLGPGAAAAVATLPVVLVNALVPLVFHRIGGAASAAQDEAVTVAFAAFLLTWLASFKALALAAGRGPLAEQPWPLLQTWALLAAPIVPVTAAGGGGSSQHAGDGGVAAPPGSLIGRWLLKAATTGAVVFTLLLRDLPPWACSCLYAIGIYSMLGALRCGHAALCRACCMPHAVTWRTQARARLSSASHSFPLLSSAGVVMDGPAALVLRLLRLRLAPHFRAPWESRSFAVR